MIKTSKRNEEPNDLLQNYGAKMAQITKPKSLKVEEYPGKNKADILGYNYHSIPGLVNIW